MKRHLLESKFNIMKNTRVPSSFKGYTYYDRTPSTDVVKRYVKSGEDAVIIEKIPSSVLSGYLGDVGLEFSKLLNIMITENAIVVMDARTDDAGLWIPRTPLDESDRSILADNIVGGNGFTGFYLKDDPLSISYEF